MAEAGRQMDWQGQEASAEKPRDVANALIGLIEDGGLKVGDRLPPELQLVQRLGFGRSTIRETLKTWETMGVVSRNKGAGTRLTAEVSRNAHHVSLTIKHEAESLLRMQEVRRPLEVEAVRVAACKASENDRRIINARAAELIAVFEAGEDWRDADVRFHQSIHEATGNPLFGQIIEQIRGCFHDIYQTPFGKPQLGEETIPMHRPLADAIIAGNEVAAVKLAADIIDFVCQETKSIAEGRND